MKPKYSFHSESVLVRLLKENDKASFEYLYDHYVSRLHGTIFKIVKNDEEANDVLQEAFLKIWLNIKSYDPDKGTLFTWVLNIARNTAIDRLRITSKFTNHIPWDHFSDEQRTEFVVSHPSPTGIDLLWLIGGLSPEKKCVIEQIYLLGHTQQETAKILNLPLSTVKSRVRLSLKELRLRLVEDDNLYLIIFWSHIFRH